MLLIYILWNTNYTYIIIIFTMHGQIIRCKLLKNKLKIDTIRKYLFDVGSQICSIFFSMHQLIFIFIYILTHVEFLIILITILNFEGCYVSTRPFSFLLSYMENRKQTQIQMHSWVDSDYGLVLHVNVGISKYSGNLNNLWKNGEISCKIFVASNVLACRCKRNT